MNGLLPLWTAQPVSVGEAAGAAGFIWLAAAIPLCSCALLLLLGRRADKWGHLPATAASFASFCIGLAAAVQLLGMDPGQRVAESLLYRWVAVPGLTVDLGTRTDPLSVTFVLLVTFVGTLIHIYAVAYMAHDTDRRRFFAYLNFFVASMLLLVLGNSYLVLFVGWEGVGLASYLLISFWNFVPEYAVAGKKAFVMNRVGDLGMLIAMMAMVASVGSVKFTDVSAGAPAMSPATATFIGIFLLLAACGKSAQFPLQAWLGDAMAGPTPVSALIHAATMVTAGVYLMVRSGAVYAASPHAAAAVTVVGLITLTVGAVIGAAKDDMKKVLAASTMSQIGYMMLAAGLGPLGAGFAIFHLVTHGFFKANMFLGAGAVMHAMDDGVNMRKFGALRGKMPLTFYTFMAGYLAIIGFPFLSGYFSKDKIIEAAFTGTGAGPWIFGPVTVAVAGLTAFYMSRLVFMIFFGAPRWKKEGAGAMHPHDPSPLMWVPMAVLAVGSLVLGAVLNFVGFLDWLAPVIGSPAHGEPVLPPAVITVLTLAVVVCGVAVAWRMYLLSPTPSASPVGSMLTRAARRDLYQDLLNESIFMSPGQTLVKTVTAADGHVIDGTVEGSGKLLSGLGKVLGALQNGYARSYAGYIVIGVVVALGAALVSVL